jgi:hypothetical protein
MIIVSCERFGMDDQTRLDKQEGFGFNLCDLFIKKMSRKRINLFKETLHTTTHLMMNGAFLKSFFCQRSYGFANS